MKKLFLISIGFFILGGALFSWSLLPKEPGLELTQEFLIEKGESSWEIAKSLEEKGLIKNSLSFELYLFLRGEGGEIKAGFYELSPSLATWNIVKKIIKGETKKERITIIEGWTRKDIASYLEEKKTCSSDDFFEATNLESWKTEYDFLKSVGTEDLEGYLFPDTYFIEPREEIKDIVQKMLDNFDKKLTLELREEIARQDKSIFEIVIMASLIEKEVKTTEDKKMVSGLLWKRLENNVPLQVDATITFLTGKRTTSVSREETRIDSPYNTYKYRGLPIGPICNPGSESINATVYPQDSDYWYYLSTPEGETIFSRTLTEHNLAKNKYLR